ncbi:PAS domain-containing protein, partial [Pelomonas sp. KK5]|uniref:PAS domain-containing protein n=1 Tax=Pelomonas sp. KK5 TaxID=1855730 RepID=UPI00117E6D84
MLPLTLIPAGLFCSLAGCALVIHAAGRRQRLDRQHSLLGEIGAADWRRLPFGGSLRLGRMSFSPAWQRITGGVPASRRSQVDGWLDEVAHPLDREQAGAALRAQLLPDGAAEQRQTLRLRSPGNGEWRWHELRTVVQQRDRRGRALRLLSTLADASGQHTAAERERISAGLFQHLQEGVLVTDLQLRVLDANPAWCRIAGQPREQLLGRRAAPPDALLRAGHDPAAVQRTLDAGQDWHGHVSLQRADGSFCTLALSITTIPEPGGPLRFRVVTATDETELLSQRQLLQRQSRYDALTGLPSQGEFMRQLRGTLEAGGASGPRSWRMNSPW